MVILPNDVVDIADEGSKEIRDLLVIQEVHVWILTQLSRFFLALGHLVFFVIFVL